jgi:hypothetical protein
MTKSRDQNPLAPLAPALNQVVGALTGSSGKSRNSSSRVKSNRAKNNTRKNANMKMATFAPAAMTTVVTSNPKASRQPFVVCKDEYSQDVIGSTGLSILPVSINPGLQGTFPWLYGQANSYQMYRFRKLRFNYYTRDSSNDKGTVALVFIPNPDDPTPTSLASLANYDTRVLTTPWQSAFVDVPNSDLTRLRKFLIRDALVANELATYDIGFLVISTGGTSTGKLGELWLTYELELFSPQPPDNLLIPPLPDNNAVYKQAAAITTTAGVATPIPWDTIVANVFGLLPTTTGPFGAGAFTGIRGSVVVYAQVSIAAIGTLTNVSALLIQISIDGGGTWSNVIIANFPYQGSVAGSQLTANVETVLQLLPSYAFRVVVITTGSTATVAPTGINTNILVLTPA